LICGPLPQVSAASIMLVGARLSAVRIEYIGDESIAVPKADVPAGLDRCLRDRPLPPDPRPSGPTRP
jgi:hypothetical protein